MVEEQKLIDYVKSQMDKPWNEWPTVRYLAKRYRCTQDEIIDIAEGLDNIDLIVGCRTMGGYGEFDLKGDYHLEWFE